MPSTGQRRLDEFRQELAGLRSGSVAVTDAQVKAQFDSDGVEYLQVTLVLADPPYPHEIWSLEDTFELRQEVRRLAAQRELQEEVRITLTSGGDGDEGADDAEDDAAEGER